MATLATRMLRLFKKSKPIMLGRWGPQHSVRKAELANHDHCGGPQCSKTALTKSDDPDETAMLTAVYALQSLHAHPHKIIKK